MRGPRRAPLPLSPPLARARAFSRRWRAQPRARARAPSRARSPLSRRYHKPRFNFFLEFGGADGLARALSEQIQKRRAEAKEEERIRAEFASSPEMGAFLFQ